MTEAITEVTLEQKAPALVRHGLYNHHGMVVLALDEERLIALQGTEEGFITPNSQTTLLEMPGTSEWADRMVRARNAAARHLRNLLGENERLTTQWQAFGDAILEKAEEKSWCEEYDAFAEEWGLPTRVREYDVLMTVRVVARNEDDAMEIVQGGVNLSSYNTSGVVSEPDFSADVS